MASANTDSWSRDPVADANPELPRKRERLSEEAENSPLSTDGSVVVEALPPDDVGTSYANAIELHDDTVMPPFSESFALQAGVPMTAIQQLEFVAKLFERSAPQDPQHIDNLAQWVINHVDSTQHCNWREGYLEEVDFFSALAKVCFYTFECQDDMFDASSLTKHGQDHMGDHMYSLHIAVTELSIRMLDIIPEVIDRAITRRDSGQVSKSKQRIDLLYYVQILAQTTALHRALGMNFLKDVFHLKPKSMTKERRTSYIQHPTAPSHVTNIFVKLAQNQGELVNAWDAMDAVIHLVLVIDHEGRHEAEVALDIAHMYILPVICSKHPRSVPEGFHELLVTMASRVLAQLVKENAVEYVAVLYDRYVKTDYDALLPEASSDAVIPILLKDMSNNDQELLAELMTTAWILQALKAFIYSNIMDVRSNGILLLSQRLLDLYNAHRTSTDTFDHPVLQYVARFMRTNELTKYIFGPDSHASLVSHSQNIIGFLAATLAYTDLETDIIWHACTNSVEAEFVKASFGVLVDLSRYLDLEHLLYLTNKYAITPPSKLGKDAVDSLTDLFQKVQIKSGESGDQKHRLATAFISIDIMMRVTEAEDSQSLSRLKETAKTELSRFTDHLYNADDRMQIYSRCVPNIVNSTEHSTTSIDILLMFLRSPGMHNEAKELLSMLPVEAAVDELGRYIESRRDNDTAAAALTVPLRMEVIVRLMALAGNDSDEVAVLKFYRYTVGDLAQNNLVRDRAWNLLVMLTTLPNIGPMANAMLHHLLANKVVDLPLQLVTPELVKLFGTSIKEEARKTIFQDRFSLVLNTSMWQKLVEVAESTGNTPVDQLATETICELLFEFPHQFDCSTVVECHTNFARQQIDRICQEFASPESPEPGPICQKIGLLNATLVKSRQYSQTYQFDSKSEICLATEPEDELLRYSLQLYGSGLTQPRLFQIQANRSTSLSELSAKLPSITGAVDNRVIIGGKLMDLSSGADQPLCELGLQPSGVILLCPKHTPQSDLDVVLTISGAIEQEVIARYEDLEKLLDGPDAIARKMFLFITSVRPPTQVRRRISSDETPIEQVCPPSRIWRSAFSFGVLQSHLKDFARLGVADENFIRRGIRLFVTVITDENRPLHPETTSRAMRGLICFLQELSPDADTADLINDSARLASRLIDTSFYGLNHPIEQSGARQGWVDDAFKTLIQCFRRQSSVWQHFTSDSRAVELHAQVLFDSDLILSLTTAETIRNFCLDSSAADEVADFYLKIVLALLPQALAQREQGSHFFDLATEVMFADRLLRGDEGRVREITTSLISTLWGYAHAESVDLPVSDMAVTGLLRLLSESINILKSFKKPLQLQDFATHLVSSLLFPAYKDVSSRPLIHQQSRRLAYRLVQTTCESRADFLGILDQVNITLQDADANPLAKYPGLSEWLRPSWKCSGLPNLGMTCYMNSLLQQLFANVHFRKFVFETPVMNRSQQPLLHEVQKLFAQMQDSYSYMPDTAGLAKVLGIQTDSQEDVHGFYEDFLSRLESNMPDETEKKALAQFFTGKMIQQIKGECGHVSPQTEPFVDLPVVVRNKTCLSESLDEYVQGEPMEGSNQYKCQACQTENGGRLVNAMKRSCPEETPDNLTFCLKRFTYESMVGIEGKVNDRFEFPQSIDMSRYRRDYLDNPNAEVEEDLYELVGVIVHQGTLHLGHYWSYTLLRNTARPLSRTWVKLEDRNVAVVQGGVEEVQRECFGGLRYSNGNERADNAYVLFYQRKARLEEALVVAGAVADPGTMSLLPPKVAIPRSFQATIHDDNAWRHRIAHLFEDDFHAFVNWMVTTFSQYNIPPTSLAVSSPGSTPERQQQPDDDILESSLVVKLTTVAMSYIQRVAVCDTAPSRRTRECLEKLKPFISEQPRFAGCLLQQLLEERDWFAKVPQHDVRNVRTWVNTLVLDCLKTLRHNDHPLYRDLFPDIRNTHSAVFKKTNLQAFDWADYLRFAKDLAQLGVEETAAVLDDGYWRWVFDMFQLPFDIGVRKRYPGLSEHVKNRPDKVSALYDFLCSLLTGYVDLENFSDHDFTGGSHTIGTSGVLLNRDEMEDFFKCSESGDRRKIFYWMRCSRFALKDSDWKNSSSGKFLALLTSRRVSLHIMREVEDSLLRHIDVEDDSLTMIVQLVMHFCATCTSEHDPTVAQPVFLALVKVLNQWDGAERDFAKVRGDAYRLMPQVVLASLDIWIPFALNSKHAQVRHDTATWLAESVFNAKVPLTGPPEVDVARSHYARKIASHCSGTCRGAFNSNRARGRWESHITVALAIEQYLRALLAECENITASTDEESHGTIGSPLLVELREVQATLNDLHSLELDVVNQWELETAHPGTIQDVRRSVEFEPSDEPASSDDDWEEEEMP